ncbi:CCA-adding enzyme [Lentilactobacillus senioris DSM 24302 = JCM 17472]|uniref:CCA-adding enzyme n=1 Tax=Lentilactobacillus senioris DSM 24302 = JCM 17472 TaxID=1423802 RepID=A0A0R2D0R2_9LACO|nr:CCA tRNA nucleotidyltransferase [Lentilactobacillus senioris]KRM93814.1 CCA-adding enzyme [Lentilactobacillus senioris DSM 24302 = JCM 17472]
MQLKQLPEEFKQALPILTTITAAGFEAYFVGGSVRDTILNKPIHDVDIASSAYPAEVKNLFKKTVDTGIQHGTVMILDHGHGYEVTTFRTESGYQDYRRPDQVTFVRSLAEDLMRRDFTINALAMNAKGVVTDLFGGLTDLNDHVIKAVGDPAARFHEDALRMMRAVRFSSQLNFQIEAETKQAIASQAELLTKIAMERIHEEFVKLMMGQAASQGVEQLISTKLYQYLPGLNERVSELRPLADQKFELANENQVWSFLAMTLGISASQVSDWLKKWKTANKIVKDVTEMVQLLTVIKSQTVSNWDLYVAGRQNVLDALAVSRWLNMPYRPDLLQHYDQLVITQKKQLTISGKELMQNQIVTAGPVLGQVLSYLEQQVVAGDLANEPDLLVLAAKNYVQEISK